VSGPGHRGGGFGGDPAPCTEPCSTGGSWEVRPDAGTGRPSPVRSLLDQLDPVAERVVDVAPPHSRELGHWEADQIIGANNRSSMLWLTERVTRYSIGVTMPEGYGRDAMEAGLACGLDQIPPHLLRSVTFDQGSEWACWETIASGYGIDIWFCDPHSPWQPGQIDTARGSRARSRTSIVSGAFGIRGAPTSRSSSRLTSTMSPRSSTASVAGVSTTRAPLPCTLLLPCSER
jgi:hypothetical protein